MVYELRIALEDVTPAIWRRLRVPGDISMAELHRVIQIAMGWSDAHLHQYVVGGETIGLPDSEVSRSVTNENSLQLADVALENTRFRYEYDFGDRWRHDVLVERVLPESEAEPRCIAGYGACPPEDCGGWSGYDELLEILADPNHSEHQRRLEALGGSFDAAAFDPEEVNARLRRRSARRLDEPAIGSTSLH
jgi:hypothetical protein